MVKRTVYVPRFGSQRGSSQRDEPEPGRAEPLSHGRSDERGNKLGRLRGENTRFVLKVKLPKLNNSTASTKESKEDKTPRRLMVEDTASKTNTTMSQGGAGTDSGSVGRDVFSFFQTATTTAMNEKEKAKHAVLKTISRMLEENQIIRQRLALSQQGQQRLH